MHDDQQQQHLTNPQTELETFLIAKPEFHFILDYSYLR